MNKTSILIAFVLVVVIGLAVYTAISLGKDGSAGTLAVCTMIGGVAVILARKIDRNDAKTDHLNEQVAHVKAVVDNTLAGQTTAAEDSSEVGAPPR